MNSDENPLNNAFVHVALSTAYVFVFLSTIIGNVVILTVILSQRRARNVATNFFLANLSVADLLVGIFCVLQNAVHFVFTGHGQWPFGKLLCYTYVYTLHLIPNVSAGILVLVSVERLFAVLRPLRVRRAFSRKVLLTSAAFVWAGAALMNMPYYYASQYMIIDDGNESHPVCTRSQVEFKGMNMVKAVTTLNFIVWYALPLLTLLCIYTTIGIVVSRASDIRKTSASTNKLLTRSSEKSTSGFRSDTSTGGVSVEKRRKVGRLALGIVVSFATLSLPRYVYVMWFFYRDPMSPRCLNCLSSVLQPISFLLLFLNSAINPFLYAFLSIRFRQCIKDTFACGPKKKDGHYEMSSRIHRPQRRSPNSEIDTAYEDT